MYLGNADPMLQVARYKNNEDVTRAATHHISKTVAGQRARDRSLGRRSSHHLLALGRLAELRLPKWAGQQPPKALPHA